MISNWISTHAVRVAVFAVVFGLAAAACGADVRSHLTLGPSNFQDPAAETIAVTKQLERAYGYRPDSSMIAIVRLTAKITEPESRVRVESVVSRIESIHDELSVTSWYSDRNPVLVSQDERSTYMHVGLKGLPAADARTAADRISTEFEEDPNVTLGGFAVTQAQFDSAVAHDIQVAQLVAIPLLMVLLLFAFRGVIAALVPLMSGCFAVLVGYAALRLASEVVEVSIFSMSFVSGLALGLGIDYSLLMVARYREEFARLGDRALALETTMRTAGKTVVVSALIIGTALGSLLVFPQPILYSMGISGFVVAITTGLVSVILVPAVLKLLGPRIDSLSVRQVTAPVEPTPVWASLTRFVIKRPAVTAILTSCFLIALSVPALNANFSLPDDRSLPDSASGNRLNALIDRDFLPHSVEPLYVIVERPAAPLSEVRDEMRRSRGQFVVIDEPGAQLVPLYLQISEMPGVQAMTPFSRRGDIAVSKVVLANDPKSAASQQLVRDIRELEVPGQARPLIVGGYSAMLADLKQSLAAHLPLALSILAIVLTLGMFFLTKSIVLALKTLLMGALTFTATIGTLVLAFQHGALGGVLGFEPDASIGANETIVLLVLAFALTSDYAAIILSRAREAHDRGLDNDAVIAESLARTGPVVTSAALMLAAAVGAFVTASNPYLQQLGFGVAFAVLIDATVVRMLLVPSLISLLGKWNWWTPRWGSNRSNTATQYLAE